MTEEEESPIFSITDRGFNLKAWYLEDGNSKVIITQNGEPFKEFLYPSYKIFNIAAHFSDIIDGELSETDKDRGYEIAGSDGLGGTVMPKNLR